MERGFRFAGGSANPKSRPRVPSRPPVKSRVAEIIPGLIGGLDLGRPDTARKAGWMSFIGVRPRGFTAAAVLLAAVAGTSAARAGSAEDRTAAREHLTQAQDLKKQGQLAEALTHYQESERLEPKLTT